MKTITDDKIIKYLKRLNEKADGVLSPAAVVDAARPENSPIHEYFEWDDTEAAEQFRVWQARQLLRVCVEFLPEDIEHKKPLNIFCNLTTDRIGDAPGYRTMVDVLSDEGLYDQLLQDALAEMKRFQAKYRRIEELKPVFKSMRKIAVRVNSARATVRA